MRALKGWCRFLVSTATSGLLAVVVFATPAAAVPAGSVAVSPATVAVGGTVTVSGFVAPIGCPLPDGATLISAHLFPNAGFGPIAPRNSSGAFSTTYVVPISTSPGTYTIGLRCGGGNVGVFANLQVTKQVRQVPTRAPQAGLGGASNTAGHAVGWVIGGTIALALGGLLMFGVRRRRSSV